MAAAALALAMETEETETETEAARLPRWAERLDGASRPLRAR